MALLISGPLIPRTKSAQGRSEKCSILILTRFGGIETRSIYLNFGLASNTKGMAGTQKIQVAIKKLEEAFNPFLSIRKEPNDKDEDGGPAD